MLNYLELKARRLHLALSQDEFAKLLGISREHLSPLENRKVRISRKFETRYDKLFPKRLIGFRTGRRVDCTRCTSFNLEGLNEPDDPLNTIWHCKDCGLYLTGREAWGID